MVYFICSMANADETFEMQPLGPVDQVTRFDNQNWFTLAHPEVATFTMLADGSMHGSTVSGIPFEQYNVPNDLGIRVQRFEMQDHYHYIIEGKVAYTFEDFSAKLALAYASLEKGT